jgi:hypothetical protein
MHRAAVAALRSITANVAQQQQAESVLMYLIKHAQHVDRLHLKGKLAVELAICQLPPNLHPIRVAFC